MTPPQVQGGSREGGGGRGGGLHPTAASPSLLLIRVLFSLLTHVAELTLCALLAYSLYNDVIHRDVFFALASGLTILPLVTLQLLSAIFLLRSRGDSMSGREAAARAWTHVLQLGFVWRHLALVAALLRNQTQNASASTKFTKVRADLKELHLLRLVFALTGGLPLLLLQLYLILTGAQLAWAWLLPVSLSVGATSCVWTLASSVGGSSRGRRGRGGEGSGSSSSPLWAAAAVLCVLWRAGELVSRMTPLALFGCLYGQWVVGVLGGHWVLMVMVTAVLFRLSSSSSPSSSPTTTTLSLSSPSPSTSPSFCEGRRVLSGLLTSYSFVWCFVTVPDVSTALWYVVYYVIVFVESGILCVVWLMESEGDSFVCSYLPVVISAVGFAVSLVSLTVHHRHFVSGPSPPPPPQGTKASLQGTHNLGFVDCESGYDCSSCQAADGRHNLLLYKKARPVRCGGCEAGEKVKLKGTGVHHHVRPWLDMDADCLSIATASTGHLPRHTATTTTAGLDRGFGTCGDGVCAGRCQGYSSAPTCVSIPGYVDMTQTNRSSSLCTLLAPGAHPLGEDGGRSSDPVMDPVMNLVPSWMVPDKAGLMTTTTPTTRCLPPLPPQHTTRHHAAAGSVAGLKASRAHSQHLCQQQQLQLQQQQQQQQQQHQGNASNYYRCVATSAERSRLESDGYSTDHTVLEWSRLPLTPLAANVWRFSDTDTDHCYGCYVSPSARSELSSSSSLTTPASRSSRSRGCQECRHNNNNNNDDEDDVYGIPREVAQLRRKESNPHMSASSELRTATCPPPSSTSSCLHQVDSDSARGHSLPSVFTVSSSSRRTRCRCCGGSDTYGSGGYYMNTYLAAAHSDGSARDIYGVGGKKGRRADNKRKHHHRHHHNHHYNHHASTSLGRHDQMSVCSSTFSSLDASSVLSVAQSAPISRTRAGDRDSDSHHTECHTDIHVPSKLQVRALVEKSDKDSTVKVASTSSLSPTLEPIYQNVSNTSRDSQCDSAHDANTTSGASDDSAQTVDTTTQDTHRGVFASNTDYEYLYAPKCLDKQRVGPTAALTRSPHTTDNRGHRTEHSLLKHHTTPSLSEGQGGSKAAGGSGPGGGRYSRRCPCKAAVEGGLQDATGHACSESEDSALPPETLSSSMEEGGLDSEHNEEYII